MTKFNYFELIASFYYSIFDLTKQGASFDISVNRSLDNFWLYPELDNRLLNLVIDIQYLHVKYSLNKFFTQKQIEVYKKQLELIKNDDLSTWLNPDELNHLNESIQVLNAEIEAHLRRSKP